MAGLSPQVQGNVVVPYDTAPCADQPLALRRPGQPSAAAGVRHVGRSTCAPMCQPPPAAVRVWATGRAANGRLGRIAGRRRPVLPALTCGIYIMGPRETLKSLGIPDLT